MNALDGSVQLNRSFHNNVASSLNNKQSIADCVFLVGNAGKKLTAIGSLLALQSEYFEKLVCNKHFKKSTDSTTTTYMPNFDETDVSENAFQFIIHHCYGLFSPTVDSDLATGFNACIDEDNVIELLYASNKYLIDPIVQLCNQFIAERVNSDNISKLLVDCIDSRYGLKDIETKLIDRLQFLIGKVSQIRKILSKNTCMDLPAEIFSKLLRSNENREYLSADVCYLLAVKYCMHQEKKHKISINIQPDDPSDESVPLDCDESKHMENSKSQPSSEKRSANASWFRLMKEIFVPVIRFDLMSNNFFASVVRQDSEQYGFLTKNELFEIAFKLLEGRKSNNQSLQSEDHHMVQIGAEESKLLFEDESSEHKQDAASIPVAPKDVPKVDLVFHHRVELCWTKGSHPKSRSVGDLKMWFDPDSRCLRFEFGMNGSNSKHVVEQVFVPFCDYKVVNDYLNFVTWVNGVYNRNDSSKPSCRTWSVKFINDSKSTEKQQATEDFVKIIRNVSWGLRMPKWCRKYADYRPTDVNDKADCESLDDVDGAYWIPDGVSCKNHQRKCLYTLTGIDGETTLVLCGHCDTNTSAIYTIPMNDLQQAVTPEMNVKKCYGCSQPSHGLKFLYYKKFSDCVGYEYFCHGPGCCPEASIGTDIRGDSASDDDYVEYW